MAASLEDIQVSGMYVTSRVICRRRSAARLMVVLHNNLVSLHLQQLKSCFFLAFYNYHYAFAILLIHNMDITVSQIV